MKKVAALIVSLALSTASFAETIRVAAAISLKDALGKVAESYSLQSGDTIEFIYGSSGQLATQIKGGAPIDLFISAANKQVDDLAKDNLVDASSRVVVAANTLVAVVPADAKVVPASLSAFADPNVSRLAIGETKSVPAGQYAEQALRHAGVFDLVKNKLVLGANVRQVLDYVERGEVAVGLVYATDALAAGEKVRVAFTVRSDHHEPIVYPAVLVSTSTKKSAANAFLTFLQSESGQKELAALGFIRPSAGAASTQPAK